MRTVLHYFPILDFFWFDRKSNLHAHVHICVSGGNQILAVSPLPDQLQANIGQCDPNGHTHRGSEDEFVRITWRHIIRLWFCVFNEMFGDLTFGWSPRWRLPWARFWGWGWWWCRWRRCGRSSTGRWSFVGAKEQSWKIAQKGKMINFRSFSENLSKYLETIIPHPVKIQEEKTNW